ncbi:cytoplasmic dynein 2 light intermediate chain 1 [Trichogramma pretiosum]|uniref:cytoplasmic dynein 2 light intermediate chain 1 n=1 Tax=Trichogramma pretiosum TaxID=7493 RepID=UPI0006C95CC9|nr:cytoplasmic dynein 2 light intermediate chain 1 [Trichogramma pretiosum]
MTGKAASNKETKENARDVALRLATQEEKRRKSDPHESREKSLIVLGSREVGKTTMIYRFLEKEDTPKPTLAMDYAYGRKAGKNLVKDIVHVWEIGHLTPSLVSAAMKGCCLSHSPHHTTVLLVLDLGKPETLWNTLEDCLEALQKGMEMSYPRELIEQVLNEKLRGLAERSGGQQQSPQQAVDEMSEPFPLRLCLVGGRYDEFRGTDADDREFMGRALRAAAHALAASLHYHSAKDAQLLRRSKDMLSNYGFKGQSPKTTVIDHEKPLSVAAGADSFASIELYDRPAATAALSLEEIKRIYVTRFPQRARDQEDQRTSSDGANYDRDDDLEHLANDESFAEPIIDRLVLQREEEISVLMHDMQETPTTNIPIPDPY